MIGKKRDKNNRRDTGRRKSNNQPIYEWNTNSDKIAHNDKTINNAKDDFSEVKLHMDFPENIKKAANWNKISPMVLDNIVSDFSSIIVDNITINHKENEVPIHQLYDIMDAETAEQIEQDIFETIYDDKKTIDFAVKIINNFPEGYDYHDHVVFAMQDVVNNNDFDDDYVHNAVNYSAL